MIITMRILAAPFPVKGVISLFWHHEQDAVVKGVHLGYHQTGEFQTGSDWKNIRYAQLPQAQNVQMEIRVALRQGLDG